MPDDGFQAEVWDVLSRIPDPELPVPITDLGIVERVEVNDSAVHVTLIPTFLGCPALDVVLQRVRERVGALPQVNRVHVEMVNTPVWSPDRISENGREILRSFGVAVPPPAGEVVCPFCESTDIKMESAFGTQRCRMIYYCNACHKPFELFKKI